MCNLNSGVVGIDHGEAIMSSDFEGDGQMWRGNGSRKSIAAVTLATAFTSQLYVQVSISMWDISNNTNNRADVLRPKRLRRRVLNIVFRTWDDTQIARIRDA